MRNFDTASSTVDTCLRVGVRNKAKAFLGSVYGNGGRRKRAGAGSLYLSSRPVQKESGSAESTTIIRIPRIDPPAPLRCGVNWPLRVVVASARRQGEGRRYSKKTKWRGEGRWRRGTGGRRGTEEAEDAEEKRGRERDEEARGKGPGCKSLQGLAVSPLCSENRSPLETRENNKSGPREVDSDPFARRI